jgi:hypothetical protein
MPDCYRAVGEEVRLYPFEAAVHDVLYDAGINALGEVETYVDYMGRGMAVELKATILAESGGRVTEERTVAVPATWWEMFKRDCLPNWFRRRWPVRTKTMRMVVDINAWVKYPHLKTPLRPRSEWGQGYYSLRTLTQVAEEG